MQNSEDEQRFVSRGGLKLQKAIEYFGLDLKDRICADLGANVGGFTDCLLQNGAIRVYSVDTAYGELAWKLRNNPAVVPLERVNAIHFSPREEHRDNGDGQQARKKRKIPRLPDFDSVSSDQCGVDLVVIDLGWTRQKHAIPAAMNWLKTSESSERSIITLIKPHYEVEKSVLNDYSAGVLPDDVALETAERVAEEITRMDERLRIAGLVVSPIRGSKEKRTGNLEYLAYYQLG